MTKKPDKNRGLRYKGREFPIQTGPCPTPLKVAHATRAMAKIAKRQQRRPPGVSLRTYLCSCNRWHVGTMGHVDSREEARAIARRKLGKKA